MTGNLPRFGRFFCQADPRRGLSAIIKRRGGVQRGGTPKKYSAKNKGSWKTAKKKKKKTLGEPSALPPGDAKNKKIFFSGGFFGWGRGRRGKVGFRRGEKKVDGNNFFCWVRFWGQTRASRLRQENQKTEGQTGGGNSPKNPPAIEKDGASAGRVLPVQKKKKGGAKFHSGNKRPT